MTPKQVYIPKGPECPNCGVELTDEETEFCSTCERENEERLQELDENEENEENNTF